MMRANGRDRTVPSPGAVGVGLLTAAALALVLLVAGASQVRWISPGGVPFDYTRPVDTRTETPIWGTETDLSPAPAPTNPYLTSTRTPAPSAPLWAYLAVVGLLMLLVLGLALRWGLAARSYRAAQHESEVDALTQQMRVVAEDEASHVAALLRGGSPRNAIVACWVGLEDTVARLGLPRQAADTSSDTTERVLGSWPVDQEALSELAALYRRARFSEHETREDQRQAALDALQRFHCSLEHAVDDRTESAAAGEVVP